MQKGSKLSRLHWTKEIVEKWVEDDKFCGRAFGSFLMRPSNKSLLIYFNVISKQYIKRLMVIKYPNFFITKKSFYKEECFQVIPDLCSLVLKHQQLNELHPHRNFVLCYSKFQMCHQSHHEEFQLQQCSQPVRRKETGRKKCTKFSYAMVVFKNCHITVQL